MMTSRTSNGSRTMDNASLGVMRLFGSHECLGRGCFIAIWHGSWSPVSPTLQSCADSKRGLHEALSRMPAGRRKSCTKCHRFFPVSRCPDELPHEKMPRKPVCGKLLGSACASAHGGVDTQKESGIQEGETRPTNWEVQPTRGRMEWEALNYRMSTIRGPHDCHNLAGHTTAF